MPTALGVTPAPADGHGVVPPLPAAAVRTQLPGSDLQAIDGLSATAPVTAGAGHTGSAGRPSGSGADGMRTCMTLDEALSKVCEAA